MSIECYVSHFGAHLEHFGPKSVNSDVGTYINRHMDRQTIENQADRKQTDRLKVPFYRR